MALIREMVVSGVKVKVYDDYAVKTQEEKMEIVHRCSDIINAALVKKYLGEQKGPNEK